MPRVEPQDTDGGVTIGADPSGAPAEAIVVGQFGKEDREDEYTGSCRKVKRSQRRFDHRERGQLFCLW